MISIFVFNGGILIAQTYCSGDQISLDHQNQTFEICYPSDDYSEGDSWSLADYNGELNGGNYHILFIDMSATW
tara:strand:- start:143 stop:361 length:219 start_codon:yes stop_codon:yes gene_type:complete